MCVIKSSATVVLSVGMSFCAFAGGARTVEGDILTYDVPSGEIYVESESIPGEVTTVIKTGDGTLDVRAGNASRKTDLTVEVRKGYVTTAINTDPFGGEKTLIKVLNGGALWFTGAAAGQKTRAFYRIEIAGDGPDGKGAFYRTGASGGDCLITNLKLTDGATIGGDKKFGVRYTDLNFHTLTNKVESGTGETLVYASHEYGSHVKNPGNIVQLSNSVTIDSLKSWNGVADGNSWTVAKASCLDFFTQASGIPFPWEVKAEASPTFRVYKDAEMLRGVSGVGSGVVLTLNSLYKFVDSRRLTVHGMITNVSLVKESPLLAVSLQTNDHYFSSMNINGGSVEVVGNGIHKLHNSYNSSFVKNGGRMLFKDAGDVFSDCGYISVCNSSADGSSKPSFMDVAGETRWSATNLIGGYLWSRIYLGEQNDVYGTESVKDSGWGRAAVRDGAVVTNNFIIGNSGVGALMLNNAELYQPYDIFGIANGDTAAYGHFGSSNSVFTTARDIYMAKSSGSEAHYVQCGGVARNRQCAVKAGIGGYANFYVGGGGQYDTCTTFADPSGAAVFHLGYNAVGSSSGGEGVLTVEDNARLKVGIINLLARENYLSLVNLNRGGCLAANYMHYSSSHVKPEGSRLLFSFNGGRIKYCVDSRYSDATVDFLGDSPDRMIIHELGGEIEVARNSSISCKVPLERPAGKSIKAITLPTDADFVAATNIGPARIIIEGVGEGASAFASYDSGRGVLGEVVITSSGTGYDESTKAYITIPRYPERRFECGVELMEGKSGGFVKSGAGALSLNCPSTYDGATVVKGGQLTASCHWAFPSNTLLRIEGGTAQCNSYNIFFEAIEGTSGNIYFYLRTKKTVDVNRLSLFASPDVKLTDGYDIKVHGDWKVSAADVVAAKSEGRTPGYSCSVQFGPAATIEFDGTEGLTKDMSPYVICSVPEGKSISGRPALVNPESLGDRWAFSVSGSKLILKYRNPFSMIIR